MFVFKVFDDKYQFYRKEVTTDGENVELQICDTAGIETIALMRDIYLKKGQDFIMVYSTSDMQSLNDLSDKREQSKAEK